MSDDQIARMLQDSFSTAEQDMKASALAEAKVDAERMLMATQSALAADGNLLEPRSARRSKALMEQLRKRGGEPRCGGH